MRCVVHRMKSQGFGLTDQGTMDEEGAHHWTEGIAGEMMTDDHGRLETFDGRISDVIRLN